MFRLTPTTSKLRKLSESTVVGLRERPLLLYTLVGLLGTLMVLGHTAYRLPAPNFHDEFSYLLAADTFARGRLTNPPHPMWEHFESFHIIHQPTYASKYPPARGLMLALGQRLGHPIIGVAIATGLAATALVWMIGGFLPRRWLPLAAFLIALHPGLQLFWARSYWGGTIPLTGAALVFGAYARLGRKWRWFDALLLGAGISLLAASRPFEGLIATLCVGTGLAIGIYRRWKVSDNFSWRALVQRVILPVVTTCVCTGLALAYYNRAVTGDCWRLPYSVHDAQYLAGRSFIGQSARELPPLRHKVMQDYSRGALADAEYLASSLGRYVLYKTDGLADAVSFYLGCSLLIGLAALPWVCARRKHLFVVAVLAVLLASAWLVPWNQWRYYAVVAPLLLLLSFAGLRYLRIGFRKNRVFFAFVLRGIMIMHLIWFGGCGLQQVIAAPSGWQLDRVVLSQSLEATPGDDLVFVRYGSSHDVNQEWVYNAADIDASPVVWAREISPQRDQELQQYFKNRRVWLLQADHHPRQLVPYDTAMTTARD